jgi:hypothetical protein
MLPVATGEKEELVVTQLDVARAVRLDVSSVNKILHRKRGPRFRRDTVERVFRAARKLGYPIDTLKHPHRRTDSRRAVSLQCELSVYLNGAVFDRGTALITELSPQGARIEHSNLPKGSLPLAPFVLGIKPAGFDLELRGRLVRFHSSESLSLGIALYPLEKPAEALLVQLLKGRK